MKDTKKKTTFNIEGLDCANCAVKIEDSIKKIQDIDNAKVDFINKKLKIETNNIEDYDSIFKKIISVSKSIDSDVQLKAKDNVKEIKYEFKKKEVILLMISFFMLISTYLFDYSKLLNIFIYIIAYLIVGYKVIKKAALNIRHGRVFDENFLMTIATVGAFAITEYSEAVAVMLFYKVGEMFQEIAVDKSRRSISNLMDIKSDYANVEKNEKIIKTDLREVNIGDKIIIKPGEKIPLDGIVIKGRSFIDTSSITGESIPFEAHKGTKLISGTINKNGLLKLEVKKEFENSTVNQILKMVEDAQERKAPTENFITKFAKYYTPTIVFLSIIIAFLPLIILQGQEFSDWIYRALVFLVVSCPCALVISIPMSYFAGIGKAAKEGILFKGGNYLDAFGSVKSIIFDKTGTITEGTLKIASINAFNDYSENEILQMVAYAESHSGHPIARAILDEYKGKIDNTIIKEYNEKAGYGIKIRLNTDEILVGNLRLMKKSGINPYYDFPEETLIHIAKNGEYSGYIVFRDKIKKDAKIAIEKLKELGIENITMLTGDKKKIGNKIGQVLKMDTVYSQLLPNEKIDKLIELEKKYIKKGKVAFVGDGINDAPVIARAEIGIAMGELGSDAAIEAADIVLMTDEPSKISKALQISSKTKKIVWQNIILALGIKFSVLVLGVFGIATMWEAVFADVGVTLIAVLNSLRILKIKND